MKARIFKNEFFNASVVACGCYFLINAMTFPHAVRLVPEEAFPYLFAMFAVILTSGAVVKNRPLWVQIAWAIVIPEVGAIAGYLFMYFLNLGGFKNDIPLVDILAVSVLMPFFVTKIWLVSLVLLSFCGLNNYYKSKNALK